LQEQLQVTVQFSIKTDLSVQSLAISLGSDPYQVVPRNLYRNSMGNHRS